MFADPQSFKWDGTNAISLARVGGDLGAGRYKNLSFAGPGSIDTQGTLTIGQQYTKSRSRRTARFDMNWSDISPLVTGTKVPNGLSVYVVVDAPLVISTGSIATYQTGALKGLSDWMSASTYAAVTKLVNGET